jgi:hypothetical protein
LQRLEPLFAPILEALCNRNRFAHYKQADETRWLVFVEQQGQGELTKLASIIASPLTSSTEQDLGFSGVSPLAAPFSGGMHGCYDSRGLNQEVFSPLERSACRQPFAPSAGGHCGVGNMWSHRRL